MVATDAFQGRVATLLDSLRALAGCGLIWRDADRGLRQALGEHGVHCHPYCRAVKATPGGLARCLQADDFGSERWCLPLPRRRRKRCHGGVVEVLVPLADGGDYAGCFFIGPFRETSAALSLQHAAAAELPVWDAAHARHVVAHLHALAPHLLEERRRALARGRIGDHRHPAMRLARERLGDAARADLRAKDLAREAGLSAIRFVHLFKEATGLSFTAALREAVMRRARAMLADGDEPIGTIADRLGYANQNYFTCAFRRTHGCTPSIYRRHEQSRPAVC
ncbi:MAG: helix-turn-helix domain-containing protein [Planctomycetota bacterium]